ncbi:hypothetical protein KUCAC02_030656, partial [Chaenocephalus aceratus]
MCSEAADLKDTKQPTTLPPSEETLPRQPEWIPGVCQDEPGPSQIKEEEEQQKEELWINGINEPPSADESDDGDALTKELIKTVQQLEDCRAAEEGRESEPAPAEDPEPSEERTSTTLYRCHICNYIFTKKKAMLRCCPDRDHQTLDFNSLISVTKGDRSNDKQIKLASAGTFHVLKLPLGFIRVLEW